MEEKLKLLAGRITFQIAMRTIVFPERLILPAIIKSIIIYKTDIIQTTKYCVLLASVQTCWVNRECKDQQRKVGNGYYIQSN